MWSDVNGDGQLDADEPGIADVRVELVDGEGTFLTWTTTDADGYYLFPGLDGGSYQAVVPASNFDEPADTLWGQFPTDGPASDPDSDVDGDSDGVGTAEAFGDVVSGSVVSDPVLLSDLLEPQGETDVAAAGNVPSDPNDNLTVCLLYTSPSPRDATLSRMPSSA